MHIKTKLFPKNLDVAFRLAKIRVQKCYNHWEPILKTHKGNTKNTT